MTVITFRYRTGLVLIDGVVLVDDEDYDKTKEADLDMMESEDEYSTTDQEDWQSDKPYNGGNYLMVDIMDMSDS